jgi:hypothetical protein
MVITASPQNYTGIPLLLEQGTGGCRHSLVPALDHAVLL